MNKESKKSKRKFVIIIIATIAYTGIGFVNPAVKTKALKMLVNFLIEMLSVLPAVLLLSNLLMAWIPRETVMRILGNNSGFKGRFLALFVGSFSAGPIYAAFPLTQALIKKGASVSNAVIILSSWAVIKVPMLLVEAQFLGVEFMLARLTITLPFIFLLGFIMEKTVKPRDFQAETYVSKSIEKRIDEILVQLPGYNCKVCGYDSCLEFSSAIASANESIESCTHWQKY